MRRKPSELKGGVKSEVRRPNQEKRRTFRWRDDKLTVFSSKDAWTEGRVTILGAVAAVDHEFFFVLRTLNPPELRGVAHVITANKDDSPIPSL